MTSAPDESGRSIPDGDSPTPPAPDLGATIPASGRGSDAARRGPDEGRTIAGDAAGSPLLFAAGSIIDQRFEDITEIGRGGMGIVYRARDRQFRKHPYRNPVIAKD